MNDLLLSQKFVKFVTKVNPLYGKGKASVPSK